MDVAIPLKVPLVLRFEGAPDATARFFDSEYGHMRTAAANGHPDLLVRFVDSVPPPQTWESFGPTKMLADDALIVIDGDARARITIDDGGRVIADVESRMAIDTIRRRVVLPSVALLGLGRDAVLLHASATCGPHGTVLLLGDRGVGKTSVLIGLVNAGHEYVADDRLLLARDCTVAPLQGMLELRLDFLASQPELGRLARCTGWRQAHMMRSLIRAGRGAAHSIPTRFTRRTAGALRSLEEALDAHCFFLDPRQAFHTTEFCPQHAPPQVILMSHGVPDSVEAVAPAVLRRWLEDEVNAAYRPLIDLLVSAARVSVKWERVLDEVQRRQGEIAADAAAGLKATRVRTAPGGSAAVATSRIIELAARPTTARETTRQ